jgi:molybdenum cofactor cytidylyltransferase
MSIGIILLAAGSSSRMGQSKQLLKVNETSLIVHAASQAIETGMTPIVVVLGANEHAHRQALANLKLDIVFHPGWEKGMGGSLKSGLNQLLKIAPETEAVIVMVCDQPLLKAGHLQKLMANYSAARCHVVASGYSGTAGVPALFDKVLFPEIQGMPDEEGAKKIILRHSKKGIVVDFPEGSVDMDTPEDFRTFLSQKPSS